MNNTPLPQESLALYVKRIRTSLGISQTELALKAGIHLQSLGKIERAMTTKLNSTHSAWVSLCIANSKRVS